jgi:hypothetical protein
VSRPASGPPETETGMVDDTVQELLKTLVSEVATGHDHHGQDESDRELASNRDSLAMFDERVSKVLSKTFILFMFVVMCL